MHTTTLCKFLVAWICVFLHCEQARSQWAWGRKDGSEFSVNLLQAWTENTSSEAIRTMKHDSLLPFGTSVAGRSPSFTYYGFGDNVINVHDLEDPEITHKADLWHVERYFAFTVHPEQAVLKSCAPTLLPV